MPRFPLILLLGFTLPVQALTFQTRMENVAWSVDGDKFECRLSQQVDGFGEAVFVRRAGERPVFELSAASNIMRPGPAQLYNDAPPWRPGTRAQLLGQGTVQAGHRALRLPFEQSGMMLAGLAQGLQPTIQRSGMSDAGNQIRVVISPVGYQQAWLEFQSCTDGLLPMNIDQIARTPITFPSAGTTLTADARQLLDVALEYLREDPAITGIELEGHSDSVGDRLSNRELSRRRVLAVQAYLLEQGLDESLITMRFHGDRYPVASNATAQGRAKNRRVVVRMAGR